MSILKRVSHVPRMNDILCSEEWPLGKATSDCPSGTDGRRSGADDADKRGDIATQVQQGVHLDGGFVFAKLRPWK
jgi:hypothetical protein